jgi:26S proteasome regulatory subunit T1
VSRANMAKIFSYGFTTAHESENGGGPYAAQRIGGIDEGQGNMFGEMTSKGLQTSVGTIAGLGYGLPMSRLYAAFVYSLRVCAFLTLNRYFGGSLDLLSLDGWGSDVFLRLRCLDEVGDARI